jgi:hypothetical protein
MKAQANERTVEPDIFSVWRELTANAEKDAPPPATAEVEDAPDAASLLLRFKQKEKLVRLIKGHANTGELGKVQQQLQETIAFLEGVVEDKE